MTGTRVDTLLAAAVARFARAGVATPRPDAELLLAHAAGVSRAEVVRAALVGSEVHHLGSGTRDPGLAPAVGGPGSTGSGADGDGIDGDGVEQVFAALVDRRAARVPLQHLTGRAPFRYLDLAVGPGVFVPRPETEVVAQAAIDEASAVVARTGRAVVVDLCTGSGAIALAVATEVPGTQVHAVELDAVAYDWAARNVAETDGVVHLIRGDARRAFAGGPAAGGLDGQCDVVVSNPPYVPRGAVPVDPEVAEHDPAIALYGLGADGLEVPRGVTAAAARLLRPRGLYVMEHAEVQGVAALEMVGATGLFDQAETRLDLTGRPRMVWARRL